MNKGMSKMSDLTFALTLIFMFLVIASMLLFANYTGQKVLRVEIAELKDYVVDIKNEQFDITDITLDDLDKFFETYESWQDKMFDEMFEGLTDETSDESLESWMDETLDETDELDE